MTETLSPAESRDLRCIAGMMIPASSEFDVPGADDATIIADIVAKVWAAIWAIVREALGGLSALAGGALSPTSTCTARRDAVVAAFRGARWNGGGDLLAGDPAMLLPR